MRLVSFLLFFLSLCGRKLHVSSITSLNNASVYQLVKTDILVKALHLLSQQFPVHRREKSFCTMRSILVEANQKTRKTFLTWKTEGNWNAKQNKNTQIKQMLYLFMMYLFLKYWAFLVSLSYLIENTLWNTCIYLFGIFAQSHNLIATKSIAAIITIQKIF